MADQTITDPKLLLVEGIPDKALFVALLVHFGLTGVQVINYEGRTNLRSRLSAIKSSPDFVDMVTSMGIVRDADDNVTSAFESVRDALVAVDLPAPSQQLEPVQHEDKNPKVAILIVPPGHSSGAIEDVCLASVASNSATPCVDAYIQCIEQIVTHTPRNQAKAKVQVFLASRPRPGLLLGEAASRGDWVLDHKAFDPLKQLLRML